MRKHFALLVVLAVVLVPALVSAQGMSAIKVNRITVSPDPFRAGANVAVTCEIQNTGGAAGAGMAYMQWFKADTWLAADYLGGATEPVAAMAAGEKRTITFAQRFAVPSPAPSNLFVLRVTVIDPPNEFGTPSSVRFPSTCSFGSQRLVFMPRMQLQQLKLLPSTLPLVRR